MATVKPISGKTNVGLVEFCKAALADKAGYVYGTFGNICTTALLDDRAARYPQNYYAGGEMRKVGEKWLGRRVMDCSGLLKYYLISKGYGTEPVYRADVDYNPGITISAAKEFGPISTIPEIPGLAVIMPGHIGIYIGNGEVIESAGTYYGVVKTSLKDRRLNGAKASPWTQWYKIPWITYVETANTSSGTTVKIKSKTSYMRQSAHTAAKTMYTLPVGTKVTWVSDCKNGWSKIKYKNKTGYIQNTRLSGKSGLSKYQTVIVMGNCVRVRKSCSTASSANIYKTVNSGYKCTLICKLPNGWLDVCINNKDYYIYYDKSYIKIK